MTIETKSIMIVSVGGQGTLLASKPLGRVLLEQGYPANYQIIVDRINNSDTLEVMVEMTPENFSDNLGRITEMEKGLVAALKAMLDIYAKVRLVAPKTITRSEGKAVRVIDKRKI